MKNKVNNILVFSQADFEKTMQNLCIDSFNVNDVKDKAFIQIIGTPECLEKYLEEDTKHYFNNCNADNVLNLAFDDIASEELIYDGVKFIGMSNKQAEQIVTFIEIHKGKDFYISCRAGRSRSQAICRYILDVYGDEYGYYENVSCRKDNPCNTPNIYVVALLKRVYYQMMNTICQNLKLK